jgi:hypothetical protein
LLERGRIARNTVFIYKGKAFDVKQIGSELRVRHVLEGSVLSPLSASARASSDNPHLSEPARADSRRGAQGRAAAGMNTAHRLAAILAVRDSVFQACRPLPQASP